MGMMRKERRERTDPHQQKIPSPFKQARGVFVVGMDYELAPKKFIPFTQIEGSGHGGRQGKGGGREALGRCPGLGCLETSSSCWRH